MVIITGLNLNRRFKEIPEYKLDLGLAVKIDSGKKGKDYSSGGQWNIKDKNIKKFYDTYGKYINRIGKIGTLLFYIDYSMSVDDIIIMNENEIYKSEYNGENIRLFLSQTIEDVLTNKLVSHMKVELKKEVFVDVKNMSNKELSEYLRNKSREK